MKNVFELSNSPTRFFWKSFNLATVQFWSESNKSPLSCKSWKCPLQDKNKLCENSAWKKKITKQTNTAPKHFFSISQRIFALFEWLFFVWKVTVKTLLLWKKNKNREIRTDSLILSLFVYGLEVWGSACKKYLDRIDNFCKRTYRSGYTAKADFEISTLIEERDKLLFNKITTTKDHPLQDLLPPKRPRMFQTPPDKNRKI